MIIEIPIINAAKTMANAVFLFCTISFHVFSGVAFSMMKYPINKITIPTNENTIELINPFTNIFSNLYDYLKYLLFLFMIKSVYTTSRSS